MNCRLNKEDIPACYILPNMKEVRAQFLWDTKQHKRLEELREKVYKSGRLLNYDCPFGIKGRWVIN